MVIEIVSNLYFLISDSVSESDSESETYICSYGGKII